MLSVTSPWNGEWDHKAHFRAIGIRPKLGLGSHFPESRGGGTSRKLRALRKEDAGVSGDPRPHTAV